MFEQIKAFKLFKQKVREGRVKTAKYSDEKCKYCGQPAEFLVQMPDGVGAYCKSDDCARKYLIDMIGEDAVNKAFKKTEATDATQNK